MKEGHPLGGWDTPTEPQAPACPYKRSRPTGMSSYSASDEEAYESEDGDL